MDPGQRLGAVAGPDAAQVRDPAHRTGLDGVAVQSPSGIGARNGRRASALQLVDLTADCRRDAADVLTEAFLHNPVWTCIGPRRESARRRVGRHFHNLALRDAMRYGGPSWCALRNDELVGVAVAFGRGEEYPPPLAWLTEGSPFILAGPGGMFRAARVDLAMKRGHPDEPYLYLWLLGVDPPAQRQGVGRALLGRVLTEACDRKVPVYLETTKAANVPYYASHGFRLTGDAPMPRGARVWYMWHDAGLVA